MDLYSTLIEEFRTASTGKFYSTPGEKFQTAIHTLMGVTPGKGGPGDCM